MSTSFILTPTKRLAVGTTTYNSRRLQLCPAQRRPTMPQSRTSTSTRMSLLPFIPNWLVLGAWAFGAYRFYLGFNRTPYQSSFRVPLALAWPLLFAVNSAYRKNFARSIGAANDD